MKYFIFLYIIIGTYELLIHIYIHTHAQIISNCAEKLLFWKSILGILIKRK